MPVIKIACPYVGTILIPCDFQTDAEGNQASHHLAAYSISSAEKLHEVASNYAHVMQAATDGQARPVTRNGSNYSLEMAQADFAKHAK